MNTISTLSTADLTKAWHIEKRAHAFPWSEQTLASNQGERYCNYQLSVDGEMAAFAITQVYWMRLRCSISPSIPRTSAAAWGERCWSMSLMKSKNSRRHAVAGGASIQRCRHRAV
ncbi:ribosomal-protein-S18p-alanine acetyltransferase [Klebsiella pneumoniae]|uniref:Ribosomal-protein-S18p-alanine acetyltransferase n=1 Tax=Klebsiella pneumoniae TaxID=573 RepID=A0A377ZMQ4_KLEPN|nr:ribosomal-protein-S18p-alanine acetyltransferase [Klebsiella pneumoniae]